MNILSKQNTKIVGSILFLCFLFCNTISAQFTTIQGTIRDSVSKHPISYATLRFEDSTVGGLSDDDGKFKLSNKQNKNVVTFSLMGYNTKSITIPVGQLTTQDIYLSPEGVNLTEIVVRPKKEKYSKKDNPAVALIKKVIAHKNDYLITAQDYYQNEEYDRIFFALNEFDVTRPQFKKLQFLENYTSKSKIDEKKILPFSIRETLSDVFYRKSSDNTRRVVKAHQNQGVDQGMDTETIDAIINEVFKNVEITDNNINLMFHDFVGPLNSSLSVDFYKWYIIDTVDIQNKRYINLGFVPFNTRDVGFSGNLYVTNDSTYAIKRVSIRVPKKININFVEEMVINQEFEELSPNLWIPKEFSTAIDLSMYGAVKLYVEKIKTFDKFAFNQPLDIIFRNPAPEIYLADYKKHNSDYWAKNRPQNFNDDYKMDEMMKGLMSNKLINLTITTANILSSQYVATSKDENKNKLDLGTTLTFFSYNRLEGSRFRLTGATNKNFHPNLYLYGYLAYGTRDQKLKYMGEATWSFNKRNYHKDEFPENNLSVSYKYDVNALGQRFLQAERDNILMSTSSSKNEKLTYDKIGQINYMKEHYNGFSFNIFATSHEKKPAYNVVFETKDIYNKLDTLKDLRTSEVGLVLRYAPNEKFFQQRRQRRALPSKDFIYTLSLSAGVKDFLGGQYDYQKASLSISKQFWVAPLGRIITSVQGEKIWGEVPFPLLLSANANSSYTIQRGSFYLLEPMEFINDSQFSWEINHRMGGWLLNRIPIIKNFKWREVLGFRGFIGNLSKRNNPEYNRELMLFPQDSFTMGKTPYMEYSIGIENIFQFFRIDYVRRLNYLDHPNINKDGIRISFDVSF